MTDSASRLASPSSSSLQASSSAAALVTRSPDFGRRLLPVAYALSLALAGCSGDELDNPAVGGAGGAPQTSGGMANGGSLATGGTPSATGGSPAAGGTPSATGGTAGTGGASGGSGGALMDLIPPAPDCVMKIVAADCTTACHTASSFKFLGNVDLTGDFVTRLKNQKPVYAFVANMAACKSDALLLDSARPQQSVFLKKVLGTQDCGEPMPSKTLLPQDKLGCISSWLSGGAAGGAGGAGGGSGGASGGSGGSTAGSGGAAGAGAGAGGATAGSGGGGKGGGAGAGGASAGSGGGGGGSGGASAGSGGSGGGGSGGASAGAGGGGKAG